jgi:hypothetical protein
VIKSKRKRLTGHEACTEEIADASGNLGDEDIDGKVILK